MQKWQAAHLNGAMRLLAEQIIHDIDLLRRVLRRPIAADLALLPLTVPQMRVLDVLARTNGLTLKELSAQVDLAHSTVSGIIDRLERQKLVRRVIDATDRRYVRLYVSDDVQTYVQNILPTRHTHPLIAALEAATPVERDAITDGLQTLLRLLKAQEHSAPDKEDAPTNEDSPTARLSHFL